MIAAWVQRLWAEVARFRADQAGATLVEFAMVFGVFIFLLFGVIDFGRLGFSYVMATKATETAVRMAVVRPPVCAGLPVANLRGTLLGLTAALKFGTACNSAEGLCAQVATKSCSGSAQSPTAVEIWSQINALMPSNARIDNLEFSYRFDSNLGFLGGAYRPVVTVEIKDLAFEYISPLGALAAAAGAATEDKLGQSFSFPSMSASLPAEDLR
jgi:hypothetical protein